MRITYPNGVPCWVQLDTPDPVTARSFYTALFGWTYSDDDAYAFARLDGQDAGAIQRTESPSRWVSFIACDDIDATCAAVERSGGTVLSPPDDGAPYGRSAACADPLGAEFLLWQAQEHPGSQIVNVPGAWNFSDLHTPDPEASLAFYGAVFGWRVDADLGAGMIRLPGYGDHLASTSDPDIHERQAFAPPGFADVIAGLTPDDRSEWVMRFTVDDRDGAVATALDNGAQAVSSIDTEWTKEAELRDPVGALLVVSQLSPPE